MALSLKKKFITKFFYTKSLRYTTAECQSCTNTTIRLDAADLSSEADPFAFPLFPGNYQLRATPKMAVQP